MADEIKDSDFLDEEEEGTPVPPEASLEEKVAKLEEQNKRLFARAKTAEEKLKEEKKEKDEPVHSQTPPASVPPVQTLDIEGVLQLQSEGFSQDEILKLGKYAKELRKPLHEVAKDPLLKAGIEKERERKKVEQATPSPSSNSPEVQGKTWDKMTDEERRAALPQILQSRAKQFQGEAM